MDSEREKMEMGKEAPPSSDLYVANPSRLVDTCLEQGEHTDRVHSEKVQQFHTFLPHVLLSLVGFAKLCLKFTFVICWVDKRCCLCCLISPFCICHVFLYVWSDSLEWRQTLEADRRFIYTLFPSFHLQNLFLQRKKNGRGETRIKNTKRIAT